MQKFLFFGFTFFIIFKNNNITDQQKKQKKKKKLRAIFSFPSLLRN